MPGSIYSQGRTEITGILRLQQQKFTAAGTIDLAGGPVVLVDTTSAAFTLTTPTVANCGAGWTAVIVDTGNNLVTNNVTLTAGSGNINGGASATLNLNRAMFLLVCDGTNFSVAAMTSTL